MNVEFSPMSKMTCVPADGNLHGVILRLDVQP